jgi:hypothetical protein
VEFNRYAPLGGKQAEDVIKTAQAAMKETAAAH